MGHITPQPVNGEPPAGFPRDQGPKSVARFAILNRGISRSWPASVRTLTTLAIAIGAAAVAASAAIHLHLWLSGYRHIHLIGPAFLAQVIIGFGIAALLVAYRRLITVVAGAVYSAGSAVALLLSATVGFLGLHDGLGVPWASTSLIVELVGAAVLTAAGAILLVKRQRNLPPGGNPQRP